MAGTSELIDFRKAFVWLLCGMLLPSVALVAFGVVAVVNERAAVERRLETQYGARLRTLDADLRARLDAAASAAAAQALARNGNGGGTARQALGGDGGAADAPARDPSVGERANDTLTAAARTPAQSTPSADEQRPSSATNGEMAGIPGIPLDDLAAAPGPSPDGTVHPTRTATRPGPDPLVMSVAPVE